MYWAEDRVGPDRIKGGYAYKDLLNKYGKVALGTDFPVERIYPLETFYAAITRQDREGSPEGGFYPDESLSREEALLGMTIWPAFSNFEDQEKGSQFSLMDFNNINSLFALLLILFIIRY